jgi:ankyrin repeat protein
MIHLFLAQVCKLDRDMYRRKLHYEEMDKDKEILSILLSNKAKEVMLSERDESYGNTPLHVACSLHSFSLTNFLIEAGADQKIQNLAEKTPKDIVESEIAHYAAHLQSEERDLTLERLRMIKSLFP